MQDGRFTKTLPAQSRGFLRTQKTADVENDRENVPHTEEVEGI